MKAEIKIINFNGASPVSAFNSVKELKTYLNEMLYYAEELILNIECKYTDNWKYSEVTDLRGLLSEAKFYNSVLCVNFSYEPKEEN